LAQPTIEEREDKMPNYPASERPGGNPNRENHSSSEDSQGITILQKYFPDQATRSRSAFSKENFDTYRGMLQLRELLRGGQISKSDYEAAKTELLFD
jgi:hypothetical protein